jgi:O-antigen ligase
VVAAVAATAAWRPCNALLLLAGLNPLAATILALTRTGAASLNFFEAMVLGVLLGWAVHHVVRPQAIALPARFEVAAAALLSFAFASVVTSAIIIRIEHPDRTAGELFQSFVLHDYLIGSNPLTAGMLFVEGVALMILVAERCALDSVCRYRLLRMMVVGATAAAFLNVMRIFNASISQPHPLTAFAIRFAALRVNMHFPDLNAAGSYFALMFFVALGFVPSVAFAFAAVVLIAAAVWVAGSRTALVASLGAGGLVALFNLRRRAIWSIALLTALAATAAIAWQWYPKERNLESSGAFAYRVARGQAALQLIRAHPVFGVRPGNFSELSGLSDNAHNNYLQIGAELGVPALVAFVYICAFAVRTSWREGNQSWLARGVSLGLIAYLVTCLTGHPLLIAGAAYPFWMVLGVAAAFAQPSPSRAGLRWAALTAVLIVAALVPFQIAAAARDADVEHASVGFSKWQHQSDGSRYRWAGGRATFYVSPAARSLRIPLRRGQAAPANVEVRIYLDGVEANRVILRLGDDETIVRLNLIRRAKTRFARVDLESRVPGEREPLDSLATDSGGVLMVGRPIPEG